MQLRFLCVLAIPLVACGGESGGNSTAALQNACEAQSNVPPGLCECVGEESRELSEVELEFVVASLKQDEAAAEAARGKLGITELTRAGMFFLTASQTCAERLSE